MKTFERLFLIYLTNVPNLDLGVPLIVHILNVSRKPNTSISGIEGHTGYMKWRYKKLLRGLNECLLAVQWIVHPSRAFSAFIGLGC